MVGSPHRRLFAASATIAALFLLAGCAAHEPAPQTASPATASPHRTSTAAAEPTSTPTPSPTGEAGQCDTADLTGRIGEFDGKPKGTGDGMNQLHVAIILTNNGTRPCHLQGWPGTSLVGGGDGTQLGAAAKFDRSTPHPTVTLRPGGEAQAPLHYTRPGVYEGDGKCHPADADGFRVYPPGSRTALFIPDKLGACTLTTYDLLTVGAFVPYP